MGVDVAFGRQPSRLKICCRSHFFAAALQMKEAFRVLDDNGDGFVEVSKLANIYQVLCAQKTIEEVHVLHRVSRLPLLFFRI